MVFVFGKEEEGWGVGVAEISHPSNSANTCMNTTSK